mmetsp:Transcript_84127/g.132839  ORF Transcript_84127/g.132839 Transcript_84127/m.132839 type:complete len:150 (-) Transcript_84127:59-508(-)|eukprot:CAMPEP_0169254966 /NCGR_PEP_ID=MMETSP1016-20121227/39465_1 /TAXON_ID=342587 /ORGANISM="Karlodinium micrum, Strain CCMP2283" /LENGTH=149 /DNA_ID=CAMNT_0009336479 /DNA_START=66 /DNA_END=515 /DNA_ORIENTATION=+
MTAQQLDADWRRRIAVEVLPQDFPPSRPYERNPIVNTYSGEELIALKPPRSECSSSSACGSVCSSAISRSSSQGALRRSAGSCLRSAGESSIAGRSHGGRSERSSTLLAQLKKERKMATAAEEEIAALRSKLDGRQATPFPLNKMSAGR